MSTEDRNHNDSDKQATNAPNSKTFIRRIVRQVMTRDAKAFTSELRQSGPTQLAEHQRIRRGFERRLQARWGTAFDLLDLIYLLCEESGTQFNQAYGARPEAAQDNIFLSLIRLHASACQITSEISALCRTGHANGALARWRSLHETAVTAAAQWDQIIRRCPRISAALPSAWLFPDVGRKDGSTERTV